jgi:hypothetical protein
MFKGTFHVLNKLRSKKSARQLEDSLEDTLKAGRRHAVQFAKLAALARTIRDCEVSEVDGLMLVAILEEVADRAELDATFDAEATEMMANGLRQERQAELANHGEHDESYGGTFVTQSTVIKH